MTDDEQRLASARSDILENAARKATGETASALELILAELRKANERNECISEQIDTIDSMLRHWG